MPKPLLLRRPSGLYARYWVPLPLRQAMGSNYIVRSLCGLRGDAARLEAARLGYALAHRFNTMKREMQTRTIAPPAAMLGERINGYVRGRPSAGRALRLFLAWVGDKLLAELSAKDVHAFAQAMHHWPRDAGRRAFFKGASPQEVVTRAKRAKAEPIGSETNGRGLELIVVRDLVLAYGGDWLEFVAELERRLGVKPKPASALIRKSPKGRKA